jgi:hypothetical protein
MQAKMAFNSFMNILAMFHPGRFASEFHPTDLILA